MYIDGHLGTPFAADLTRDELLKTLGSTSHGFSFTPTGLAPGRHTAVVNLLDDPSNSWLQWKTITINA